MWGPDFEAKEFQLLFHVREVIRIIRWFSAVGDIVDSTFLLLHTAAIVNVHCILQRLVMNRNCCVLTAEFGTALWVYSWVRNRSCC
jgi:hypothetical protein